MTEERINPQPLPPRQVDIPVELLQTFKEDMRIVSGVHVAGLIMVPPWMLGELQAKLGDRLALVIVDKSEIEA
jgi:hypothetical protein